MDTNDQALISLDNFDPNNKSGAVLNSPRSLEACRRQGIKPQELIKPSLEDARRTIDDPQKRHNEHFVKQLHKFLEEKRASKLKIVKEVNATHGLAQARANKKKERDAIIEEERKSSQTSKMGSTQSPMTKNLSSSLIEKEKKVLEKLKKRQEQEMKKLIDYETKMEELRIKNEEKLMKEKERERKLQIEAERKKREADEIQRLEDLERKKREDEEAALLKQKEQEVLVQERERLKSCLLYTSPSPRDGLLSRMPSSA
eukprot:TRINITY_DN2520_c0_g1_i1.p1 TRINITY_DN2520_c0_g1~~TRINITY_DN2520_c0_g1_i1.p1  ORF type:complete len:258 (-),score=71.51 TRINITY_DN2520_c0_g1_i1:48-821(-)